MDDRQIVLALRCSSVGCLCQKTAERGRGLTHCPAHDDRNPSLSVALEGERVLFNCKAGCTQEQVLSALQEKGLWAQPARQDWTPPRHSGRRTYYEVRDTDGTVVAVHVRIDNKAGKQYTWQRADGRKGLNGTAPADMLYGLEMLSCRPGDPVVLTEGEKAADSLRRAGDVLALATVTGAAGTPSAEVLKQLCGRRIYLWPDEDDTGHAHMERIAEILTDLGAEVYVVEWEDAPEKADAADYVATHDPDQLAELLRSSRSWVPTESEFDAMVETAAEWRANADLEVAALIRGLLVAGGLGMVVSDPKAGKTWLAMELTVCVAAKTSVFGRYPVEKQGRVLYVATEGARAGAVARFNGLCLTHGLKPEDLDSKVDFIWRKGVMLDDDAFKAWLIRKAKDYALIVIDVLVDAWDGDENKATEAAKLIRGLRPICDAGATVLLLHHLSKPDSQSNQSLWQRVRGSTAFRGAYDSGIGLERPPDGKRTKVSFEHRDLAPLEPFTFTWPAEECNGSEPIDLDWQEVQEELSVLQEAQARIEKAAQEHPGLTSMTALSDKAGGRKKDNLAAINALLGAQRLRWQEASYVGENGKPKLRRGLFFSGSQTREPTGTTGTEVASGDGGGGSPDGWVPPPYGGEPRLGTEPHPEANPVPELRNRLQNFDKEDS